MGNKTKVRINVYIDRDQKIKLDRMQEKVGVPMSEQIRRAIDLWLEKNR